MKFFLILLFSTLLLSCGSSTSPLQNPGGDTTDTDTTNYALDTDSLKMALKNTTPPQGFYQVMLPCSDCKGIEHTVYFNPDLSYRLEEMVTGTGKKVRSLEGNWKPSDGDIWLYRDGTVQGRYTWRGDTLNFIDLKSGVLIPMRGVKDATTNESWAKKKVEGIDFYGVGNEPFWNISIDQKRRISFQLSDWPQPVQLKAAQQQRSNDSTVYNTSNDSIRLRVVVYNTFCSDGMSDYIYNNKVKLQLNGQVYNGCGIFLNEELRMRK